MAKIFNRDVSIVGSAKLKMGDSGKIELAHLGDAANSASGLLLGVGTTASPAKTSVADSNFVELRTQSLATSGDNRSIYLRHSIAGAGASGETIRALTKLEAAGVAVRGAHLSLDIASTGSVSGLGAGVDNQILLPNAALAANGTYAVGNFEVYASGASSAISAVTSFSFNRFVLGGNATGAAAVEDSINLFSITGGSNASGNLVGAVGNEPTWASNTYLVRCNLNGQAAYLVAVKV
jgi:hypothetical protein